MLFRSSLRGSRYGQEIWALYESGELTPDSELTGQVDDDEHIADVDDVLAEIKAAFEEEQERRERLSDSDDAPYG